MQRPPDTLFTAPFIALTCSDLAYATAGGVLIGATPFFVTGPLGSGTGALGLAVGAFSVTTLVGRTVGRPPGPSRAADRRGVAVRGDAPPGPPAPLFHRAALVPGLALFTGVAAVSGFFAFAGLYAARLGVDRWSAVLGVFGLVVVTCSGPRCSRWAPPSSPRPSSRRSSAGCPRPSGAAPPAPPAPSSTSASSAARPPWGWSPRPPASRLRS